MIRFLIAVPVAGIGLAVLKTITRSHQVEPKSVFEEIRS